MKQSTRLGAEKTNAHLLSDEDESDFGDTDECVKGQLK